MSKEEQEFYEALERNYEAMLNYESLAESVREFNKLFKHKMAFVITNPSK